MRVCLVTEELAGLGLSGGIGAAMRELAVLLAEAGHQVDVLYCPLGQTPRDAEAEAARVLGAIGVELHVLESGVWAWATQSLQARSYAAFRWLESSGVDYDVIHFHEFKGLGFFPLSAKRQGLAFSNTRMVVQLHGPTRWTLDANGAAFSHRDQLVADFMERRSMAWADELISPSDYLVEWLRNEGLIDAAAEVRVIKNANAHLAESLGTDSLRTGGSLEQGALTDPERLREIVLFARHEDRKGFLTFCDAIDLIADELAELDVAVTFLGAWGTIAGRPSPLALFERARRWTMPMLALPGLGRADAASYLTAGPGILVVVPSTVENSPYAVSEALALRLPVLTSSNGGARELISPDCWATTLFDGSAEGLARAMRERCEKGVAAAAPAASSQSVDDAWLSFHEEQSVLVSRGPQPRQPPSAASERPLVTVGITHFERPTLMLDAVLSLLRQDYENVEILVVDDGSHTPGTVEALAAIEPTLVGLGVRLVRRSNGYLGAARNTVLEEARGTYVLFLDDDDIALPSLVSTLVDAAECASSSVVVALNLFMQEDTRPKWRSRPEAFDQPVAYVPVGGPLSVGAIENTLGAATALFRADALRSVGGYTEIRGVGHEDHELYLRLLQAGHHIDVCPRPLYLYSVGKPSMMVRTSPLANASRVVRAADTSHDPEAWADLVATVAGAEAVSNASNRARYEYKQGEHAAEALKLFERGLSDDEVLEALGELARAWGELHLAAELSRSLVVVGRLRGRRTAGAPSEALDVAGSASRVVGAMTSSQLALLMMETCQNADEAQALTVARLQCPDDVVVSALRGLDVATGRSLTWPGLGRVMEVVALGVPLDPKPGSAGDVLGAIVEMRRSDAEGLEARLVRANERDSAEYLARNSDVRTEVEAGSLESAAFHFRTYGSAEGRVGFERSAALEAALVDFAFLVDSLDPARGRSFG